MHKKEALCLRLIGPDSDRLDWGLSSSLPERPWPLSCESLSNRALPNGNHVQTPLAGSAAVARDAATPPTHRSYRGLMASPARGGATKHASPAKAVSVRSCRGPACSLHAAAVAAPTHHSGV